MLQKPSHGWVSGVLRVWSEKFSAYYYTRAYVLYVRKYYNHSTHFGNPTKSFMPVLSIPTKFSIITAPVTAVIFNENDNIGIMS